MLYQLLKVLCEQAQLRFLSQSGNQAASVPVTNYLSYK